MTNYRATTAPQTSHHTLLSTLSMVVVSTFAPEEEVKVEVLTLLVVEVFINTSALLQDPLLPPFRQTVITDPFVRFVANQATTLFAAGTASITAIN